MLVLLQEFREKICSWIIHMGNTGMGVCPSSFQLEIHLNYF